MRPHGTHLRWAAAIVTVVLWASAFAAIRAALRYFTVPEMSLLRLLIASLVLALVAPLAGIRWPDRSDWLTLAACGATGIAGYQLLLNSGERSVSAGTAALLVNTGPLFVALLAGRFLGERLTRRGWSGVGIGLAGAAIVSLGQQGGFALPSGALLVLSAAIALAVYFVLQKRLLDRYTPYETVAYSVWIGTALLLPTIGALPGAFAHPPTGPLLAVVFLGIGASAVGFFTWSYALGSAQVSRTTTSLYAVPGVAFLVAWVWLGEAPRLITVLGGVLAIGGVVFTNTGGGTPSVAASLTEPADGHTRNEHLPPAAPAAHPSGCR